MRKHFIFFIAFLTVSLLITGESKAENNNTTMLAPDFTLKDTENVTFNLSDYESKKTVILLFMYITCEPCEEFVNEVLGPYSNGMDNESVAIISISVYGEDNETGLRDYAGVTGEPGYFECSLKVYGRAGEPCVNCGGIIQHKVIGQRASYYCAHCQH